MTPIKTNETSAFQALLGVLPFMAYGLFSISIHFGNSLPRSPIWLHPFLLFDALVLIGLGAGILAGFPRWAYSYLSWALILAGVYRFDNRLWLLPLGVFILALLVRRSMAPLPPATTISLMPVLIALCTTVSSWLSGRTV